MKAMYKGARIGAVGETDAILAFKAVGAVTVSAYDEQAVSEALYSLYQDGVPVIFLTESAAQMAREAVSRYDSDPAVSIILIPGIEGSQGYGLEKMRENVIKAIGSDLFINNDRNEG